MRFVKQESRIGVGLSRRFILLMMLFLAACAGGTTPEPAVVFPCPSGGPLASSGGPGRYFFYKVSCDSVKEVSLWAVDPENLSAPTRVVSDLVPGSLQIVTDGSWDVGGRKVAGREIRYLVFAQPGDGRLYKVSALKSDSLTPVPFSKENGAILIPVKDMPGEKEPLLCNAFTLDDFENVEDSFYIYTLAGPDQRCSTSDDNLQRMARIGMGPGEEPVSIPNESPRFIDYALPFTPMIAPAPAAAEPFIPLIDLVDPGGGGMTGWLALRRKVETALPALPFKVKNGEKGILITQSEDRSFKHNFSEGTRVMLSGSLPEPLKPDTIYSVHVTSPKTFKLYRIVKKLKINEVGREIVKFEGGAEIAEPKESGHTHPNAADCEGVAGCEVENVVKYSDKVGHMYDTLDECKEENLSEDCKETTLSPPHIELNIIEEIGDGSGTIQRVASYPDLYRCGEALDDCGIIKETTFQTICAIEGNNQIGTVDQPLGRSFVVEVKDRFGNPISGVKVTWRGGDKEEETCVLFICSGGDEDDVVPVESTTGADGRASARGILRPNGADDDGRNTNFYTAAAKGFGSPLAFVAGDDPTEKFFPPACRRKEGFFISNVAPLRHAQYGGLFNGKMVVRFDLLYKPDPENAKAFFANQLKTKGDLYHYDIPTNTLSGGEAYSSKEAFPDGLPFVSDFDAAYFADRGSIYRLPFGGNAQGLVVEGKLVAQLDLTTNAVAYSLVEKRDNASFTTLKTIGKNAGFFSSPSTLLPSTGDSLLPIMTGGENVYFQTLGEDRKNGVIGIVSTAFFSREDGSNLKRMDNAVLAGRTEKKIFGISGCANRQTDKDLFRFTFPICAGGSLISFDAVDPFSNQIFLGNVPDDVMSLFFNGYGMGALGEGDAFEVETETEGEQVIVTPGESKGVDLFYVRADQPNSLVRISNTQGVFETFP